MLSASKKKKKKNDDKVNNNSNNGFYDDIETISCQYKDHNSISDSKTNL